MSLLEVAVAVLIGLWVVGFAALLRVAWTMADAREARRAAKREAVAYALEIDTTDIPEMTEADFRRAVQHRKRADG